MSISKEAIEAARSALWPKDINEYDVKAALTAALPHLAQPSKSDEERALRLADELSNTGGDPHIPHWLPVILSVLTAVRAEASAAEREAIAKWADTWVNAPVNIADALAKIAALQRDEAHIMKQYQCVSDENAALRESVKALLELCAGTEWDEIVQAARAALEMSGGRSSET